MQFSVRASLDQFTLAHPSREGELTISVSAPALASPDVQAPVVYVVDGDLLFGMAAELGRAMSVVGSVPAHYVVGIGYDASYPDFVKLRTPDLSPPLRSGEIERMGAQGAIIGCERNGGADAFLAFLVDTLRPEIAARYPQADSREQVLFGHSLGGLFASHALVSRPDSFSAFIASSPSLWWDQFSIFQKLPAFEEGLRLLPRQPRVFVDVGGKEQDPLISVPEGYDAPLDELQALIRDCRMVDAAREFAGALSEAGLIDIRHVAFGEDDHMTAAPAALVHGVKLALLGS